MRARDFVSQLEQKSIVAAIREAELKTSGEIRVFISRKQPEDAVAAAQKRFLQLGMAKTKERNGVMIYVAPRVKKFAVLGDRGIHARCGDDFWKEVSQEISVHFRKGNYTEGILFGIRRAGEILEKYFPRQQGDKNELSDEVMSD